MAHFFESLTRTEPHSFEDIRQSLGNALNEDVDLFALLKEHHDYLRESIVILLDKDSTTPEKQEQAARFFRLLEMHGRAEQETLYADLKVNPEQAARLQGFGGEDEHDIAFQLEDELLDLGFETQWSDAIEAKVTTVANLVKNHLKQEEGVMFPLAKQNIDEGEREILRADYIARCEALLDDSRGGLNRPLATRRTDSSNVRF